MAASAAVRCRFAVVAGGPGTGKTTTVARILALLDEQAAAAGRPPPRVALAAPTGKAAARLEEAVHAEAATMPIADDERARLLALSGSTLHRLLGWRPGSRSRFRHDRDNRLPHDVVVVDEASMVSLSLMAKLVDAVRTDARLILVGDPDQLASVEAGAVLGDIVGAGTNEGIVVLRRVHRFGGGDRRAGRGDPARRRRTPRSPCSAPAATTCAGSTSTSPPATSTAALAARPRRRRRRRPPDHRRPPDAGDARAALDALRAMRVLCAHRRGPYGVAEWTAHDRALARRGDPGLRRRRPLVRRPAPARHRERLRASGSSTATPASSSTPATAARSPPSSGPAASSRSAPAGSDRSTPSTP